MCLRRLLSRALTLPDVRDQLMREITVGEFSRVRIWDAERTDLRFLATEWLQQSWSVRGEGQERFCCVEGYFPTGGRIVDGVIGGRFTPRDAQRFLLKAGTTGLDGPIVDAVMPSSDLETVRLGLPYEYAPAVVETVSRFDIARFGSGEVCIDHAAHGVIGSSLSAFSGLTAILLEFLARAVESYSDEELRAIVERSWSWRLSNR